MILVMISVSWNIFAQQNYQQLQQEATQNIARNEREFNRLNELLNQSNNETRFFTFQNRLNTIQRSIIAQEQKVEEAITRSPPVIISREMQELVRLNNRYKSVEAEYREWVNSVR